MFGMLDLLLLPFGIVLVAVALFRARKYQVPRFRTAVLELLVVVLAVGGWFSMRTIAYLSGPPDGDLYAQTWGFQGIVFLLYYFPRTLVGVGMLLLAQSIVFGRAGRNAP